MKKIYIHIGSYKSGTSSIQNYMWQNIDKMGSVQYIRTGLNKKEPHIGVRHFYLTKKIDNPGTWSGVVKETQVEGKDTFVISHEGMTRMSEDDIALVKSHLSGFDVNIVFYVRRQDEFVQSMYLEYLKNHKLKKGFSEYLDDDGINALCRYDLIADQWEKHFPGKVDVRDYTNIMSSKRDLVTDFLDAIGCETRPASPPRTDNRSITLNGAIYRLALNHSEYAGLHLNHLRNVASEFLENNGSDKKAILFDKHSSTEFMNRFKSSNQSLSDRYFGGREIFSGTPFKNEIAHEVEPDYNLINLADSMYKVFGVSKNIT